MSISSKNIGHICLVESVSSADAMSWSGGVPQRRRKRRTRQRSIPPNYSAQKFSTGKWCLS